MDPETMCDAVSNVDTKDVRIDVIAKGKITGKEEIP